MMRYLVGLFALLVMMTGEARAQLCAATCLDVETLGAATVQDQETGASTMYDSCTYTDCTCTDTDATSDPVWICCNVSTQHGWGSFGEGCASYSAGEVIVYGVEGGQPAPIPEPGEPSWSLLDWLGDLLREMPEHSEHGGIDFGNLWPEWEQPRQAGRPRGGWVFSDAEPPEPTYPPDPTPPGECGDSGYTWVCPKSAPYPEGCVCMGPDGREAGRPTLEEFAAYLHATGWYDTEDNTDNEPTPTLDDPTERIDWSVEPDLAPESQACTVETIDQPVSVQDEDGSGAAYLGGCTVVTCPGEDPVTECCAKANWAGVQTCQVIDPTSDLYPYTLPPSSLDDILDFFIDLEDAEGVPAGYEGPWRYYLYTSATDGR